jgi:hypothetical protein
VICAGSRIDYGRQRHAGFKGLLYNDGHFLVRVFCCFVLPQRLL